MEYLMSWWQLIKLAADKGISNIDEQKRGENEALKANSSTRDPSMTYAQPDMDQTGRGLTTAQNVDRVAGWGDGSVKMNPMMSQPAEMEKGVGTAAPAIGAFSQQPTTVNSSRPTLNQFAADSSTPAQTSGGLRDYLNYAKYGRRQ
jgi:hypothetical protein